MKTKVAPKRKQAPTTIIDLTPDEKVKPSPSRPSKKPKTWIFEDPTKKKKPKPWNFPAPKKAKPWIFAPPKISIKIPKKQASIAERGEPLERFPPEYPKDFSPEKKKVPFPDRLTRIFKTHIPKERIFYQGTIVVPQDIWIQVKAVQVNFQEHLLKVLRGAYTCTTLGEIFSKAVQAIRRPGNQFPHCFVRKHSGFNVNLDNTYLALPQERYQQARLELWFYYYLGQQQKVSYKQVREVINKTDIKEIKEKV